MKLLAKPITEFTYEELAELEGYVRSHEFITHKGKMWPVYSQMLNDKAQKNRDARKKLQLKEENEFPAIKAFTDNYINKGSLIKLRNTKNSGWREVTKVEGNNIIGMCIHGKWSVSEPGEKFAYTGYSSSNHISNLVGFKNPEDGKWYDRKWIIETGKKLLL